MMLVIVVSIAAPLCLVVIVLGCLDCLYKKKRFENFRISNSGEAQHNPAFAVDISDASPSSEPVTIEPLPDILAKVSTAPIFRPRITCSERGKQEATLSLVSVQRSFPRDHLTYLNEIGSGWFGQAIESEATQIVSGSPKTHVVVKMLKDDASKLEQKQFMEEVAAFRCLEHANLVSLLGQCVETAPYLVILEFAPQGNLKEYLVQNKQEVETLVKKNRLVSFAQDVAAGLACLHRHDYVHNDLAARNCLVMGDYTVKIGDYGISDQMFKEEYMNNGTELLPIRWMAPETLLQSDGKWTSHQCDKLSDMWSFGILLWEICSLGERPYDMLTDEAVLQGVVIDRLVFPADIDSSIPNKDRLRNLMSQCWQNPSQRIDAEQAHASLQQLIEPRMDSMSDFDQKWSHLMPNQGRTSSTDTDLGSRTALAGSFATDSSSPPSSKPSILNGDAGSHTDVILDMGGGDALGSGTMDQDNVNLSKSSYEKSEGAALAVNLTSSTVVSPTSITVQQQLPSSPQDQVTIENEVEKTKASISQPTPPKSSPQAQVLACSTPNSQDHLSTTQFMSPVTSPGSVYVTANETLSSNSFQGDDMKLLNNSETDFSLDSTGLSFQELSDDTLHGSSLENKTANNNISTSAQEEEDFSEFVRTSPTAPRADFTNFESAPVASKLGHEDTDAASTEKTGVASAADTTSLDHEKDVFDDFVTSSSPVEGSNVTTSVAVAGNFNNTVEGLTESWVSVEAPPSIDSNLLASDISFPELQAESEDFKTENTETKLAPPSDSQPNPDMETTARTAQDEGETLPSVSMSDVKLLNKSAPGQDEGEGVNEHVPPGAVAAMSPSLTSDSSLLSSELFSLGAAPGAPPTHPPQSKVLAELQEQSNSFHGLEPLPAEVPSVSEVLEESKKDLLSALEDVSDPFSSVEFLEHKPVSEKISAEDEEKQQAGQEKELEIQTERPQQAATEPGADLLGFDLDFSSTPQQDGSSPTHTSHQTEQVGQVGQTGQTKAEDMFGDLLGLDSAPSSSPSDAGQGDLQKEETAKPQETGASLIDF